MYKELLNQFVPKKTWFNESLLEEAFIKYTNSNSQNYKECRKYQKEEDHGEYINYYFRYKGNWFRETLTFLEEGTQEQLIAFIGKANTDLEKKYKTEMGTKAKYYKAKAAYAERMLEQLN